MSTRATISEMVQHFHAAADGDARSIFAGLFYAYRWAALRGAQPWEPKGGAK
jgi:hypothetical protein